jgi:succinoglycan biosynthesis transport protein ExoP
MGDLGTPAPVRQRRGHGDDLRRSSPLNLMTPDNLLPRLPMQPDGSRLPANSYNGVPRDGDPQTPGSPVSHYLWLVRRHSWKILLFVTACVVATVIVSSRMTPVYEATATVDIDREVPTGIVGQESRRNGLNDSDQFLATQISIIESDSVLRPVADQYNLREIERDPREEDAAETARFHDAPVVLKQLKVARPPNTYLLKISYRSTEPALAALVANAVAQSYLERTYDIRFRSSASLSSFMETQLEELKAKMERSSAALVQFERELNVINPEEKTSIISARLLQLNTEYTNAQAERVRKEAMYDLAKDGSPDALQVSTQGAPLAKLTEQLNAAEQKFAEIRTHYGLAHPEYKKAAGEVAEVQRQLQQTRQNTGQRIRIDYQTAVDREAMLKKAVAQTKAEFDRLNARSFEYQSLKREAEADRKLYDELIQKIREAGINAGFQSSSIRIADRARPPLKPVFPRTSLNGLLAFLLSSVLAVAAAVTADALSVSVRDPEQISRFLNTEVLGSLPSVRSLRSYRLAPVEGDSPASNGTGIVHLRRSVLQNLRQYEQAVQTLRNSVLLADFDRRLRSVMITSAAPFEGKSTVASHFAIANAKAGHKTLLIDGDLRRPSLQRVMDLDSEKGLAEVLSGTTPWEHALVQKPGVANLDILLAGSASVRGPELIGPLLDQLIEEASKCYDLIVLDSPPVHGFPEPLRMATAVDGVIIVALAGRTNRKALAATVSVLARLRAHILGVVLNQVNLNSSESGYYAYYQTKNYSKT